MKEQRVYEAIIKLCLSKGVGNIASEISRLAIISLAHKDAPGIYEVLTKEFQSTGDISLKVGMKSNYVSSILTRLSLVTMAIKLEERGKLKYWAKS